MGFKYIWSKTGLDKSQIPVPWFNRIKYKSKDKPDLEAKYLIDYNYKYLILIVSI